MFLPAYSASANRCLLPVNVILNSNAFPSPRVKAYGGDTSSYRTYNWRTRRVVERVQSHCGRVSTYYCPRNVKYTDFEKIQYIPATIVGSVRYFCFISHRPVSNASVFSFFFHYFFQFLLIFFTFLPIRGRQTPLPQPRGTARRPPP